MCTVEQIADCGDILSLARSLFIPEKEGIISQIVFSNIFVYQCINGF